MPHLILAALALALLAAPSAPVPSDPPLDGTEAGTLIVRNGTGATVFFVYAWACGATDKGPDLLGDEVLPPEGRVSAARPDGCHVVEVEFDDGESYREQVTIRGATTFWISFGG